MRRLAAFRGLASKHFAMDGATLDGEKIKWNMMGVVASNDHDVIVVEAYLIATKKEVPLGNEDLRATVLHAQM